MEERLISSAFYNLSMQMHRTAVENRLSNVHASSSQVKINTTSDLDTRIYACLFNTLIRESRQ